VERTVVRIVNVLINVVNYKYRDNPSWNKLMVLKNWRYLNSFTVTQMMPTHTHHETTFCTLTPHLIPSTHNHTITHTQTHTHNTKPPAAHSLPKHAPNCPTLNTHNATSSLNKRCYVYWTEVWGKFSKTTFIESEYVIVKLCNINIILHQQKHSVCWEFWIFVGSKTKIFKKIPPLESHNQPDDTLLRK